MTISKYELQGPITPFPYFHLENKSISSIIKDLMHRKLGNKQWTLAMAETRPLVF